VDDVSTYASDPELAGVTDDDGHELDVAGSPADQLVRLVAFEAAPRGWDVELYLDVDAAAALAAALSRQVARLRAFADRWPRD
jgi:hypothetical protein